MIVRNNTVWKNRRGIATTLALAVSLIAVSSTTAGAFTWPWQTPDPWPHTSESEVQTLDFPWIESVLEDASRGYSFVAFGDQRALADGEWQQMMTLIGTSYSGEDQPLFMIDTGDIVTNGTHSDQFQMLESILSPASHLPYLVGVGNHETNNNNSHVARINTARFLKYLDADFSADKMYYRKIIGPVRFIFVESNDLVYGDDGTGAGTSITPGSRAARQMKWLTEELADSSQTSFRTTVVVIHHPFLHTSQKHRKQAIALWHLEYEGRTLPDILLDGGVDVVLTGHTHTYERLRIGRKDGASFDLVNISGRPRDRVLASWFTSSRRAHKIAGQERAWFEKKGWGSLEGWTITQEEAMTEEESDQWIVVSVSPDGRLSLRVCFLDDDAPEGFRVTETTPLN